MIVNINFFDNFNLDIDKGRNYYRSNILFFKNRKYSFIIFTENRKT